MKQKLEYTREEAIINQKLVFKDEKISELQKTIKERSQEYQKRLDALRSDLYSESQQKMTYLEEKDQRFSEKLEDKAAILINLESEIIRLKSEQEKETLISVQKVSSLESKMSMLKEKYNKNQDTIGQLDNEVQQLVKENDDLKTKLIDFERDYTELHSNHERDKAIWDDRCEFLENQRNQAKRDLEDASQKFEITVEQLQRKDSSERGKTEKSHLILANNIEKKYKDQIKDINMSHEFAISDWSSRYKSLEKEYEELSQKYKIKSLRNISEDPLCESKIRNLLESEQYYQEENKKLKSQLDKQSLEIQLLLEKEKINYKQNLEIPEKKCKDLESKRSLKEFEVGKERAKWALEKNKINHEYDLLKDKDKKICLAITL
ncbi:unnamed protein product [Moneuplotes crassus]|uniref:Uncharacterized protein n=1 Tax=Euplotes crassus TaxID=5936 RepID=A0AAD1X4U9_EUPCR|nr:unnamed protein product [Moneuplotes crassus]